MEAVTCSSLQVSAGHTEDCPALCVLTLRTDLGESMEFFQDLLSSHQQMARRGRLRVQRRAKGEHSPHSHNLCAFRPTQKPHNLHMSFLLSLKCPVSESEKSLSLRTCHEQMTESQPQGGDSPTTPRAPDPPGSSVEGWGRGKSGLLLQSVIFILHCKYFTK